MSKAAVPYHERAHLPRTPPLASYLFRLMAAKKTNLAISADVESTAMLLALAEECGDSICVLKTRSDIIYDFGERTVKALMEIAARRKFLIFEDRKFADIGRAVQLQYAAGPHRIASWASIVNAHTISGPGIITALKSAAVSSITMFHSSISTEITSGASHESDYFSRTRQQLAGFSLGDDREDQEESMAYQADEDNDDDDDDDDDDDGDDEVTRKGSISSVRRRRGSSLDRRKQSVVSISTTISSSTEFISPPETNPSSPAGQANLSITNIERPPVARGLLLLASMPTKGNLTTPEYTNSSVSMARQHRDFVLGFVSNEDLNTDDEDNFITFAPGVYLPEDDTYADTPPRLSKAPKAVPTTSSRYRGHPNTAVRSLLERDKDMDDFCGADIQGSQKNTPRGVIFDNGADIVMATCAGIIGSEDHEAEAERYRQAAWDAYLERTHQLVT